MNITEEGRKKAYSKAFVEELVEVLVDCHARGDSDNAKADMVKYTVAGRSAGQSPVSFAAADSAKIHEFMTTKAAEIQAVVDYFLANSAKSIKARDKQLNAEEGRSYELNSGPRPDFPPLPTKKGSSR